MGDSLYFLENDGSGLIVAEGRVSVLHTDKLTPEEKNRSASSRKTCPD